MQTMFANVEKCIVTIILYISHSTIYTRKKLTCGSGKKYKQCCGK